MDPSSVDSRQFQDGEQSVEHDQTTSRSTSAASSNARPALTWDITLKDMAQEKHVTIEGMSESNSSNGSFDSYPSTYSSREVELNNTPNDAIVEEELWRHSWPDAIPTTSREFAELFPSSRELLIRHDDTTMDGNMNLRLDTVVETSNGGTAKMTLFHLRMNHLQSREFSLNRYSRQSGREVCHSSRKVHSPPAANRPGLRRSLSRTVLVLRSKPDLKGSHSSSLKRQDSGYESLHGGIEDDARPMLSHQTKIEHPKLHDEIRVEFSSYARVSIKRRGLKADKKYEYEYWGERYSWQQGTKKQGGRDQMSFELFRRSDGKAVASIGPTPLTGTEHERELDMGGWVPPMTLRIIDKTIIEGSGDVADVVVATGLISLCDVSIRRRFHEKEVKQLVVSLPLMPALKIDMQFFRSKTPR